MGESASEIPKSKGRPRKPLAEVILWSAPLRATSSGICKSTFRAASQVAENK